MDEVVQVQVRFTINDPDTGANFTDALYYPIDVWPVPAAQVEADKLARFEDWKALIAASQASDEPPVAE